MGAGGILPARQGVKKSREAGGARGARMDCNGCCDGVGGLKVAVGIRSAGDNDAAKLGGWGCQIELPPDWTTEP